jgi:L-ascorbate metabolism protein UlaG (beta-lactamase superfamily)
MNYLIVPVGQNPPANEGNTTMPFIKFVTDMETVLGMSIAIPAAWAAWNALRRTGRWKTANEARNDKEFQKEFAQQIKQ